MFDVIKSLYYGNLEPMETNSEYTPKLKKQLNKLAEIEGRLMLQLSDEDKILFSDYREAYIEFNSTGCADSFINGFRLGAKFVVDMFAE